MSAEFEAKILRTTASELLGTSLPEDLPNEHLLGLYAYAANESVTRNSQVLVDTIALLNVIEWLTINPLAFDVLEGIKQKYGHDGIGYDTYFIHALKDRSSS